MKTPNFDAGGFDNATFAPFTLVDARNTKWKDVRLSFHDWEWVKSTLGADTFHDYYFNGYGVEGLVKAARLSAGLDPEPAGIEYDSEGDACYIHFERIEEAIKTAELSSDTLKDQTKLIELIKLARENGFDDA